jgi:hypothetical protein
MSMAGNVVQRQSLCKKHISEFDIHTVSFTYGDMFPTFSDRVTDDAEYRSQVYTYDEIIRLIDKYGLPQYKWNDPIFGQPAYVEAQIWSDDVPKKYREAYAYRLCHSQQSGTVYDL